MRNQKLRIESLEERTLLAVTAGGIETAGALVAPTEGTAWVVNTTDDPTDWDDSDDVLSLREAIDRADEGDSVVFDSELAGGTIVLHGTQLTILSRITIDAGAIGGITLDANGESRVFCVSGGNLEAPVGLFNLTITGGKAVDDSGGGIYNGGTVTLTDCTISGNNAKSGGGIYNGGTVTLTDCTVSGNSAENGGGVYSDGTATLADCTISGNSAENGGGVYNGGSATLTAGEISGNSASLGGGVYNNGTSTIGDCTIAVNTVTQRGGGIYNEGSGTIIFDNSAVTGNSSKGDVPKTGSYGGGGIYNDRGTVTLTGCTVSENTAFGYDDSFLSYHGGGIYNGGITTLLNSAVRGNSAQTGGGIYSEYGTLTFSDSSVTGNLSTFHYGGIYNGGTATFTGCTISENSARPQENVGEYGMQYYGGGIFNRGVMTLISSIVSGNTVKGFGGGIYNMADSTVSLVCSAVFGNSAKYGGGIYSDGGALTLSNCTISGNSGGGIHNVDGILTLTNTISALNDSEISSSDGSFDGGNNIIGFDPGFVTSPVFESGKLVNYNEIDLSLSPTSWAIDRGNNEAVMTETDLAGNQRIYAAWREGAIVDIGAYEYQERVEKEIEQPGLTVTTALDIVDDTDRLISLREALFYAEPGDTINFDAALANETIWINSARLLIDKPVRINASDIGGVIINTEGKGYTFEIRTGTRDISVDIINLTIKGHGIRNFDRLELTDCIISECRSDAIYNADSASITLTNCTVSNNSASSGDGGGILNDGGTVALTSCAVSGNSATCGGGIWNKNGTVTAVNCSISGNTASQGGGIYNSDNGTVALTNCTISGNSASSLNFGGGGISILYGGTATLTNCLVSGNSAKYGGGIYNRGGLVMNGCTVTGNSAKQNGGGIYNDAAKITLYNTVAVLNKAKTDADLKNTTAGVIKAYNTLSTFRGWKESANCFVYDSELPLFADATIGDYTLSESSQAIGKGNNSYVDTQSDLGENPRIVGGTVDLGAYEYQSGGGQAEQLAAPEITSGTRGVYVSCGANRHRIQWSAIKDASGYELAYSADGDVWTNIEIDETDTVVTGLDYGIDVAYRVRALGTGSFTNSEWSVTKVFNVCPMDINGDGDISSGDRQLLSTVWLAEEGDDEYQYYCDINADGDVSNGDRAFLSNNWLGEAGDDDLIYPRAFRADTVFAEFASANPALDPDVF